MRGRLCEGACPSAGVAPAHLGCASRRGSTLMTRCASSVWRVPTSARLLRGVVGSGVDTGSRPGRRARTPAATPGCTARREGSACRRGRGMRSRICARPATGEGWWRRRGGLHARRAPKLVDHDERRRQCALQRPVREEGAVSRSCGPDDAVSIAQRPSPQAGPAKGVSPRCAYRGADEAIMLLEQRRKSDHAELGKLLGDRGLGRIGGRVPALRDCSPPRLALLVDFVKPVDPGLRRDRAVGEFNAEAPGSRCTTRRRSPRTFKSCSPDCVRTMLACTRESSACDCKSHDGSSERGDGRVAGGPAAPAALAAPAAPTSPSAADPMSSAMSFAHTAPRLPSSSAPAAAPSAEFICLQSHPCAISRSRVRVHALSAVPQLLPRGAARTGTVRTSVMRL